MAEDRQALLQHYAAMRAEFLSAIEGLSDDALTEPSIDGWSVKDHLLHLALWDEIRAQEIERISAGQESAWKMTGDQDSAYNAIGYELRRGLSLAQARWEFEISRARLLEAIAAATPRGLDASLYGEAPIRSSHEAQHAGWIRAWRANRGV
jgi:uncharacterized damage-inducible protein DinB